MTFKPNKTTPGHNLMWEGSRMMLPEHVERLREYERNKCLPVRPNIDEQEQQQIAWGIDSAYRSKDIVTIQVFDEIFTEIFYTGKIVRIDDLQRRLRLEITEGREDPSYEWIYYDDVLSVEKESL